MACALALPAGMAASDTQAKSIFERTQEDQGVKAFRQGDFKRARIWLSADENADKPRSWYFLGRMYEEGLGGFEIDYRRAERLYHRAAERGEVDAMLAIADIYARGGYGVRANSSVSRAWHERAAEAGSALGQLRLAQDYAGQTGLPPDYNRARLWFEQAAEAGLPQAMAGLGSLYRNGHGVEVSLVEALRWYRLAVKYGHAESAEAEAFLARLLDPAQLQDADARVLEWEVLTGRASDPNAPPATKK